MMGPGRQRRGGWLDRTPALESEPTSEQTMVVLQAHAARLEETLDNLKREISATQAAMAREKE